MLFLFLLPAFPFTAAILHLNSKFSSSLFEATHAIITTHFSDNCTCFIYDAKNPSQIVERLTQKLGCQRPINVVTPVHESPPLDIRHSLPLKPFPCSYLIFLDGPNSTVPWSLIRGSYFGSDYRTDSSQYVMVAEVEFEYEEINSVLNEVFSYGLLDIIFINPNNTNVAMYTLFPFGVNLNSCSTSRISSDLIGTWSNNSWKMLRPAFSKKVPDGPFNGCSWNISCSSFQPYIIVPSMGRYTGPLPGFEGAPLSLLFAHLNLTPEWTIHGADSWLTILENNSVVGSFPDLLYGRGAQMSCGGLGPLWASATTASTMFFSYASSGWYVAAPDKVPKWTMLYIAFPNVLWLLVIASGILMPLFYWMLVKLAKSKEGSFSRNVLQLLALILSNSAGRPPKHCGLRIAYLSWLIYTFHVDQSYIASLTGLIIRAEYEPLVETADQLIAKKLPTRAFSYTRLLVQNSQRKDLQQLTENSLEIKASEFVKAMYEMSRYKNFTIVDNKVFIKYMVSLFPDVHVYPTKVETDESTMNVIMERHHYLLPRINSILLRMYDAGYPVFFLRRTVAERFWKPSDNHAARPLTINDLTGPFYLLTTGLLVSIGAFLFEIIFDKLSCGKKAARKRK